jgi:hypothetical protein
MPAAKGKASRGDRAEAERRFLSAVLAGFGELEETVKKFPPGLWRRFRDRRHQVIWRALEALDLSKSFEARLDELIEEDGGKTDVEILAKKAENVPYFERELLAADALSAAGGKAYLRRLAEAYPAAAAVSAIARELDFF